MSEQIEIIKLQLQADQFAVQIQKQKDYIKDLNYSLKQVDITLKQKKELIIEKSNAEKALKAIQLQAKNTEKALKNISVETSKNKDSFTGLASRIGIASIALEQARKFLRNWIGGMLESNDAMKEAKGNFQEIGKASQEVLGNALEPFAEAFNALFSKDRLKEQASAIQEQSIKFELLAGKIELLGQKTNPTRIEQELYTKAVQQLKKEYPEYSANMSDEISKHKENVGLIKQQRDLVYEQIKQRVMMTELSTVIEDQIKSEIELNRNIASARAMLNDYESNTIQLKQKLQEQGIVTEGQLSDELILVDKISKSENDLTDAKQKRLVIEKDYQSVNQDIIIQGAVKVEQDKEATKAAEAEAKALDELTKKVEAYDKARKKANEPELKSKEIEIGQLETQIEVVEGVANAYKELAAVQVNTSITSAEYWDLQLSKAQEFLAKYGDAITQSLNLGSTYNQIETAEVENKYAKQKEALDKLRADGLITEDKYKQDLLKLDLKAEKEKKKINQRQQKIDIAMATMNMGVAITNALRTQPFFPLGLIMSGLATAQGLLNIALIRKQKLKRGGMLEGPSHEQGGIVAGNVEFEGGEGVLNKAAMRNPYLRQIASNINQSTGGVPFTGTRSIMATGGMVSNSGISTSKMERLLESLNRNVAGLELSVAVNNNSNLDIQKLTSAVEKQRNKMTSSGEILEYK